MADVKTNTIIRDRGTKQPTTSTGTKMPNAHGPMTIKGNTGKDRRGTVKEYTSGK